MSPTSTVAEAITASNAVPLKVPCDFGEVVVVGGGAVVVVVDDSVVVVAATVVVVDVGGTVDVVDAVDVVATEVGSGVDTDLAAV
jgi:hypothetical protein